MAKKKPANEHQPYDKILKENIGQLFLSLAEKQLGIHIQKSEELKDKLQTTLEREADFLRKITTDSGEVFILQLEFQTSDEENLILRMQEYHAILRKKYSLPVRQFVYYLGEKPTQIRSKLTPEEVYTGFELRSFNQVKHQDFLASQVPEEIMLALLADFGNEAADAVVEKILLRFLQLKPNKIALEKYLRQMVLLARLRQNLDETLQKQIENMALTYDIEKDSLYQKGKKDTLYATAEKCLNEGLSIEVTAKLTDLSLKEVQAIAERLKK